MFNYDLIRILSSNRYRRGFANRYLFVLTRYSGCFIVSVTSCGWLISRRDRARAKCCSPRFFFIGANDLRGSSRVMKTFWHGGDPGNEQEVAAKSAAVGLEMGEKNDRWRERGNVLSRRRGGADTSLIKRTEAEEGWETLRREIERFAFRDGDCLQLTLLRKKKKEKKIEQLH